MAVLLKGVARGPFNKHLGTQMSAGGAGEVLPTPSKLYFAYIPTVHTLSSRARLTVYTSGASTTMPPRWHPVSHNCSTLSLAGRE